MCLADLVAVLWHAGQLVLSGEQAGGLRGCRWLCGPAGLGARNCTGECADGPAGGCLCGCIWLCCLGMPCHQELDQGMRRWASWWLALQQPAGGRSQMADGEGREGRWWPVGGLARTKLAALRATRLLPCVVTLGLASNTPRRRPLNKPKTQAHLPLRLSKKHPPTFFSFFFFFQKSFYCVFGCFSAWGTQKQRKNFFGIFLVMTKKPPHDQKIFFFSYLFCTFPAILRPLNPP